MSKIKNTQFIKNRNGFINAKLLLKYAEWKNKNFDVFCIKIHMLLFFAMPKNVKNISLSFSANAALCSPE